jgi:beta-galactosidase
MKFNIQEENFYFDGKKAFLLAGEIHYFRIKRSLWDVHLKAASEVGLKAVSTYVPWAWHEYEEGVFDFDGKSCPERDLIGWIEICKAYGLGCILKPGPFILAEFRGAGLPDWFIGKYGPEVRMRNSQNAIVAGDGVSLFNPLYIEKVKHWYDQVMPLISSYENACGGPVIMLQVCNEIGVFSWLAHQADYGNMVREKFVAYLKKKHQQVSNLNSLWNTSYHSFSEVELPPDGKLPYASPFDRGRDYEWHCFWRTYYGDYLRILTRMIRERGVTVPLYHNLPGWIYGSGYEFPVNITMYEDLYGNNSEIIFGVDHIPEYVSYRNMHDDRIINDITYAMQGAKPLFAAEFQSGSREYHVVTNPREMELFYKASIANGLKGWNYYMFSQGRNPKRKGYSGDTFYWFNPLTAEGGQTTAYPLVKRINSLIDTAEDILVNARRKAEICVLFYPPYYATELERPEVGASGLNFNASTIRRPAYFDGLLKVFQLMNVEYDMADQSKVSPEELARYKQVWVFSTDEMDAGSQQLVVDYTRAGGQTVLFPCLPDREMSQQTCTIIRSALAIEPSGKSIIESPLIDLLGLSDIKCANPQMIYSEESLSGAEVIARTIAGETCGFIKKLGKGSFVHLGTWLGFDTEGHKPAYTALLSLSGSNQRQAFADNEFLITRQRFTNNSSAVLFVGNYYNEDRYGRVSYKHPLTAEIIRIPYAAETHLWPALYGMLSPIRLELIDGLMLLHTTSDLLGFDVHKDRIELRLFGDRDLSGELVLEGRNTTNVRSVLIWGRQLDLNLIDGRVVLNYHHSHKEEFTLTIKLED